MSWKNEIEKEIEQKSFIESFRTMEDFSDYVVDYFNNFFDVKQGRELIEVVRDSDKITISVLEYMLEVNLSGESIRFRKYENGSVKSSLGQLFFSEMRFTHTISGKSEEFSEQLLEKLLEKTFKPLAKSYISVLT